MHTYSFNADYREVAKRLITPAKEEVEEDHLGVEAVEEAQELVLVSE